MMQKYGNLLAAILYAPVYFLILFLDEIKK